MTIQSTTLFKQNYNANTHVVVNQGGTYSGKTFAIMQVLFCLACAEAKLVITVVGQDIPNLKVGALRDAMNIYNSSPALQQMVKNFNRSDRVYEFRNGSALKTGNATYETIWQKDDNLIREYIEPNKDGELRVRLIYRDGNLSNAYIEQQKQKNKSEF